jgi:hypothetical protein
VYEPDKSIYTRLVTGKKTASLSPVLLLASGMKKNRLKHKKYH